jgi:hypothetical protein
MCLIGKDGRLQVCEAGKRFVGFFLRFSRITDLLSYSREQEMREDGFAGKHGMIEESGGRGAEAPGFEVTPFMEEQQALVKVN